MARQHEAQRNAPVSTIPDEVRHRKTCSQSPHSQDQRGLTRIRSIFWRSRLISVSTLRTVTGLVGRTARGFFAAEDDARGERQARRTRAASIRPGGPRAA